MTEKSKRNKHKRLRDERAAHLVTQNRLADALIERDATRKSRDNAQATILAFREWAAESPDISTLRNKIAEADEAKKEKTEPTP